MEKTIKKEATAGVDLFANVQKEVEVLELPAPPAPKRIKVQRLSGVRRGKVLIKHGIENRWLPVLQVPDMNKLEFEILETEYAKLEKAKWSR